MGKDFLQMTLSWYKLAVKKQIILKLRIMKKVNSLCGAMIIALIVLGSSSIYAQDWPQWRGVNRDGKVTGFKAPQAWPKELTQVWKVNVGFGDATPILAGKRIFAFTRQGTEETVICLDASTGKEIWKSTYVALSVTGPSTSHPGPRSTPAVANGKVVTFGASGILSCFDAESGKLVWRKENPTNAVPQFFTAMSPLIVDGICYAHIGKTNDGQVLALDLNTGNEKWKWTGDGPSYASPALMTIDGSKHLIVQTEKNLISLNLSDGKFLWAIPTPVQQRFYNCVSPYIDGQIIYYTGQGTGMKAIKVEKQGTQYVTKELWSNPEVGSKWNTPVLVNGFLYGFTDARKIYCINAATGKTAWIDTNPTSDFASTVDCGSVIIGLAGVTSNLIVMKPVNTAYTENAKYKISETAVYASPVISGNDILIKDAESLTLYKIK
jgi:outer membrane protein assembly factor BamB